MKLITSGTVPLILLLSTRNLTKINNKEILCHEIITTNETTNLLEKLYNSKECFIKYNKQPLFNYYYNLPCSLFTT